MALENAGVPGHNRVQTVLASAAYKSDQTVNLKNQANKGVHVVLDVTAKTGTPTNITLTIKGKDEASAKFYTILAGGAVTGVSTNVYRVFPAAESYLNEVANDFIPLDWQITVVGSGVDVDNYFTFSCGVNYV